MFAYKEHRMLILSAIKKHLFVRSISLNLYLWYFSNLEIWNHEKKRKKRKAIPLL